MKRRTTFLLAGFALVAAAHVGAAQMTAAPTERAKASKPPRTGSIPPSPPAQPIVVNTTGLPATTQPNGPSTPVADPPVFGAPTYVTQVSWYPTVVMSDGRVLANFGTGRGYEQVLRQCPNLSGTMPTNIVIAPCFTVDQYGNYRVMQRR